MAGEFGKFKDSLNKSIASIGAKASNSVEKSKLKSQLDAYNREADALMLELGRKTYAIWKEGSEDYKSLAPQFEQIQAKFNAIQATFNEIKAIEERERLASQPAPAPVYVQPQPVMNNVYSGQPVQYAQPVQQPVAAPVYATPVQPVVSAQPVTPVQPVANYVPVAPVAAPVQPVPVETPVAQPVANKEPVVTQPITQTESGCVCPNCGASFPTEINFCRLCGAKIKQ